MQIIVWIMLAFAVLGALDYIFGDKFGLGKEFERGFKMFAPLALSMLGMLVLAPFIAHLLSPLLCADAFSKWVEPSVIMGSLFANDMGGAPLALQLATQPALGYFNGLIVGSTMGATISFTLPFAMSEVKKEQQKTLLLGMLCGICTIPIGCFVAGLIVKLPILTLLWDLIPLILFSAILAFGLLKFPNVCVKIFKVFGYALRVLVTVGLVIGLAEFLLQKDFVPYTAPIEEGVMIVFNVVAVEAGAFPLVFVLSKILKKPLKKIGEKVGINETSAVGFLATLATSVTTFGQMKDMDDRGVLLNSAFAVAAAFTFADHLAFTLSFAPDYVPAVTVAKLVGGILSVALAWILFCRKDGKITLQNEKKVV